MNARKHRPGSLLANLLGLVGFSVAAGALVAASLTPGVAVAAAATNSGIDMFQALPDYATINQQQERNIIYGNRDGKPVEIARVVDDQNRQVVGLQQVSQHAQNAAIAAEDRRYYSHGGVDAQSLARAVVSQLGVGGRDSGGSTLTMQLVRQQIILDAFARGDEATIAEQRSEDYNRKLREIKLAMALESSYTKDEILLAYLNIANFGGTVYGIQAAAQETFGIDASELDPAQSASLLAIVNEPTNLTLTNPANFQANETRRNWILGQMANEGFISQEEFEQYSAIPVDEDYVNYSPSTSGCFAASPESARIFCEYVRSEMRLGQVHGQHIFGPTEAANSLAIDQGGYRIYTSIDLDLNDHVQNLVRQYAPPEETRYDSGAAVTMLEVSSGRVLTMAQNKYYDPREVEEAGEISDRTALNYNATKPYGDSGGFPSGSTHKIFTLAQWVRDGYSVNEVINTDPARTGPNFVVPVCGNPTPYAELTNNDNRNWGNRSVTDIMVNSLNTGIMKMAERLDVCDIQSLAAEMGMVNATNPEAELQMYPSSLIGSGDNVAPISVAQWFATIANGGVHCAPLAIDRIVDRDGNEITPPQPDCNRVLTSEEASVMQHTLREVNRRNTNTDPGNAPVISKTGTTDHVRQTWASGSSPNVAASAWIGNAKGTQNLDHLNLWENVRNLFRLSMHEANVRYPGGQFLQPDADTLRGNTVSLLDVAGLEVDEAISALEGAGFENVEVGNAVDGENPEGAVEYTAPGAGTLVTPESTITVYPSNGANHDSGMSEWPDLNGMSLSEARSAVDSAGFNADNIQITWHGGSDAQTCRVLAQNPDPGTEGERGDPISIVVGGRPDGSAADC